MTSCQPWMNLWLMQIKHLSGASLRPLSAAAAAAEEEREEEKKGEGGGGGKGGGKN